MNKIKKQNKNSKFTNKINTIVKCISCRNYEDKYCSFIFQAVDNFMLDNAVGVQSQILFFKLEMKWPQGL